MEGTIGQIMIWAGPTVPKHWLLCDGKLLNITSYSALHNVIGNIHGGSDKAGTFALPDFRDVFVKGEGTTGMLGDRALQPESMVSGKAQGNLQINIDNLPPHSHTGTFVQEVTTSSSSIEIAVPVDDSVNAATASATASSCLGRGFIPPGTAPRIYSNNLPTLTLKPFKVNLPPVNGSISIDSAGSGKPAMVNLVVTGQTKAVPPWIAMKFIICVDGMYPQLQ